MQNNTKKVCRFCLKLVHSANAVLLNGVMREILSLHSIKLDLNMSEYPLMCDICLGVLNETYLFKSKCLNTEDIISAHIENNSKVCLRNILIELENKSNVHIGEDEVVCRICMKTPTSCSYIALDEPGEQISLRDMIQIHLPEMNLDITDNPIICEACHVCLKNYVSFATNCMAVEEKIKLYCDFKKISRLVDLECVRQFTENKAFGLQTRLNEDLVIKQEEGLVKVKAEKGPDAEDYVSEGHFVNSSKSSQLYLKNEEIDIKSENDEMMSEEIDDSLKEEEMGDTVPMRASNNSGNSGSLKRKALIRKSESTGRTKTSHRDMSEVEIQKKSGEMLGRREKCTKFKCEKCPHKTNNKSNLRIHNLIHMDKSEVVMHKCDNCEFETKHKGNIIKHMLQKHRDPKAERRFKCDKCSYDADFMSQLRKHNLIHMDKTEVKMHKCEYCEYETRHKSNMIPHILKHH